MSQIDMYNLQELILSSLGQEIQLIGGLLLRNGSTSFKDLVKKCIAKTSLSEENATVLCKNCVAHLIKHNLVRAWESEFDQVTHYDFDHKECFLRLSIPRYLVKINKEFSTLHMKILEDIFINGSLMKSEIINSQLNKEYPGEKIQTAIDDLIQANYIVGAQSYIKLSQQKLGLSTSAPAKGSKNKRQAKEEEKKAVKESKIEDDHDFPVKINSIKMLSEERRKAIIEFGTAKLFNSHSQTAEFDAKVYTYLINKEQQLPKSVIGDFSEEQQISFTWQSLQQDYLKSSGKELSEKDLIASLDRLFNDSVQFIKKIGFDQKLQGHIYTVNWTETFQQFQEQMMLKIIEETMSKYHSRILRLLKAKGFLEEKDILNFCVHDFKETQKFLNQLLAEGFIQHQEVQVKGTSQPVLLYGINNRTWKEKMMFRISKSCFNIMLRDKGTLNQKSLLASEFNTLYF